jgi:hypothetical protein
MRLPAAGRGIASSGSTPRWPSRRARGRSGA